MRMRNYIFVTRTPTFAVGIDRINVVRSAVCAYVYCLKFELAIICICSYNSYI